MKEDKNYYYYDGKEKKSEVFYFKKGPVMIGYTIGILLLDVWYPIIPGMWHVLRLLIIQ